MSHLNSQIDASVNTAQDEIVSFIQTLVQSPSLANDEGSVQELVSDKLKTLHLDVAKIPVRFDELKDHPAFCDDGFSNSPKPLRVKKGFKNLSFFEFIPFV